MAIPGLEEQGLEPKQVDFEPLMKEVAKARADVELKASLLKEAEQWRDNAMIAMLKAMRDAGLPEGSTLSGNGLRFKIESKNRAAYDPQMWDKVLGAAASGMPQLIQRRLNVTALEELVENGQPLPEGCRLEPYTELSVRKA